MNIVIRNIEENREEWLEYHRGRVSSSKIGVLLGLSKHTTVLKMWARDTGKIAERERTNDDMWLGNKMQPIIRDLTCRQNPGAVLKDADCLVAAKEAEWAVASPDLWEFPSSASELTDDLICGITECKNTNRYLAEVWSDEVGGPLEARAQLTWQMGVTGIEEGHLAGMIGGSARRAKWIEVEFDRDTYDMQLEVAQKYLDLVNQDIPPKAGKGDLATILAMTPKRRAEIVEVGTDEMRDLIARFEAAKSKEKEAKDEVKIHEEERKAIGARIAQLLGGAEVGFCDRYCIEAKNVTVKPYPNPGYSYVNVKVIPPKGNK